jgi:hypothetical protein
MLTKFYDTITYKHSLQPDQLINEYSHQSIRLLEHSNSNTCRRFGNFVLSNTDADSFADRGSFQEPEKVEQIQWKLIEYLLFLCKKNHKNPNQRLWQIFDKFTMLRSFAEYANVISNNMKIEQYETNER